MSQRAQQDPQILEFMKTKQPLVGDLLGARPSGPRRALSPQR
jgi:hypothetical protein